MCLSLWSFNKTYGNNKKWFSFFHHLFFVFFCPLEYLYIILQIFLLYFETFVIFDLYDIKKELNRDWTEEDKN